MKKVRFILFPLFFILFVFYTGSAGRMVNIIEAIGLLFAAFMIALSGIVGLERYLKYKNIHRFNNPKTSMMEVNDSSLDG